MSINKIFINYSQPILSTNQDDIPIIDYAYSQITYLNKEKEIIHRINIDKIINFINISHMHDVKINYDLDIKDFNYNIIIIDFNYSGKKENLNKIKKFIFYNSNENLNSFQINNNVFNNLFIKNKK